MAAGDTTACSTTTTSKARKPNPEAPNNFQKSAPNNLESYTESASHHIVPTGPNDVITVSIHKIVALFPS
jgi:hypothetical protein